jgi:hypothetical protein
MLAVASGSRVLEQDFYIRFDFRADIATVEDNFDLMAEVDEFGGQPNDR